MVFLARIVVSPCYSERFIFAPALPEDYSTQTNANLNARLADWLLHALFAS